MRLNVAFIFLSVLATSAVAIVVAGGGNNMSVGRNDTGASIGLPPSDTHRSGRFETATFALG